MVPLSSIIMLECGTALLSGYRDKKHLTTSLMRRLLHYAPSILMIYCASTYLSVWHLQTSLYI